MNTKLIIFCITLALFITEGKNICLIYCFFCFRWFVHGIETIWLRNLDYHRNKRPLYLRHYFLFWLGLNIFILFEGVLILGVTYMDSNFPGEKHKEYYLYHNLAIVMSQLLQVSISNDYFHRLLALTKNYKMTSIPTLNINVSLQNRLNLYKFDTLVLGSRKRIMGTKAFMGTSGCSIKFSSVHGLSLHSFWFWCIKQLYWLNFHSYTLKLR